MRKSIILAALTAVLTLSIFSSTVSAAPQVNSGTYEAIKKTVVGSKTSADIKTLSKGNNVTIVLTVQNAKILWGLTWNNTWINMADLKESDISAGETGYYIAVKYDVPLRLSPAASAPGMELMAKGEQIKITDTFFNDEGNAWGRGVYYGKEYFVFMENLMPLSKKVDEVVYEYDGEDLSGMKIGDKPITKYYKAETCKCVMEFLADQIYGIGDSGSYVKGHRYIIKDEDFVPVAAIVRANPEKDSTLKSFLNKDTIEFKLLPGSKEAVTNSQLDELFSRAVKGDVIQYQRSGSQHSAIYLGSGMVKDPDKSRIVPGITVIDGNWPGDYEVKVHPITYEKLISYFGGSGTGIVIYHIMPQK